MSWSGTVYLFRFLNALGVAFLYASLFLHEDDEERIQNRIEEWWVKLADKQDASRSWTATFMREVAVLTTRGFDRLFGKRLLSLRVAGISFCFSVASFYWSGFVAVVLSRSTHPHLAHGAVLWGLFFAAMALVPAFSEDGWLLAFWWVLILVELLALGRFLFFVYAVRGGVFTERAAGYLLLLFGVSFACDISYIVLTRWVLRRLAKIDRVYEILLAILGNLLILVILLLIPIQIGLKVLQHSPGAGIAIMVSFILNSIDFAAGFAVLVLALLLLLHRSLWSAVERPLYAIQRFAPIKNKKWLWRTGVVLLTLPTHTGLGFLKSLLEKF
jgi:hypothetical protein